MKDHIYQETQLGAATVDKINNLTDTARSLPPSADQSSVLVKDGEDPWVIAHGDFYYYCTVDRQKQRIMVSKFTSLGEIETAELVQIWPGKTGHTPEYLEIWSPELQLIDGRWYIYFALFNGSNGKERMYALEAASSDPQGEYHLKGRIEISTDKWAIDGSVLVTPDGQKYFIWSGWEGDVNIRQNIYIAKMSNPWTIISDRVCISTPEYEWEKRGFPHVNEGPQALVNGKNLFIIYSASGSWTDDYCLGQLTYLGGDPMNPGSWRKESEPVFSKTETIFGPGHASFVKSGGENYIIYHAARSSNSGWARQIRSKTFTWKEDGSPDFGKPI